MAEYTLLPQRENLHGVLDPALPPALRVRSGDTVHVTTLEADWRLGRPQGSPPKAPLFPRIKGRDDGHYPPRRLGDTKMISGWHQIQFQSSYIPPI